MITTPDDLCRLGLFQGYGIELEYMLVDRISLDILPAADRLLLNESGEPVCTIEQGSFGWSNELAMHVIEIKNIQPRPSIASLYAGFQDITRKINLELEAINGCLLPTAMHPWMQPLLETRLWPYRQSDIYNAYNRIFDCHRHGWSNLQSMHINLPFVDDNEFFLLHTAIRTLLPIMPAIAASSPLMHGELTGLMDTRLETYRNNADKVPSITGKIIPDVAINQKEYTRTVLSPMYAEITPFDPENILRYEWLNSRGAIPRFDRSAIEIRVLDIQETSKADLSTAEVISNVLKALTVPVWKDIPTQTEITTDTLAGIFLDVIRQADQAVIRQPEYLNLFAYPGRNCSAGELWMHLLESIKSEFPPGSETLKTVQFILESGCLARRIARAVTPSCKRSHIHETYRVLSRCLSDGVLFEGI